MNTRNYLLAIVALLVLTEAALAETRVYIRNNTTHSFTVRKSLSQTGPALPIGSYQWNTTSISPMVKEKLLEFTRASGVKNGEEYELHSELSLGDERFDLRQKMRGTLLHSKLWYSAGTDPWFDGRDWHITQWRTSRGVIEVAYRAYYTSGDDDIEYVLNPVYPPNPTQDTLNVLAYNIYMRPRDLLLNGQDIRAALLPERIRGYDVIVFSEAFDDDVRANLLDGLRPEYPYHSRILGSDDFLEQDGGVIIVSKWPIETEDQVEYEHQFLRDFNGAPMCNADDCKAEKGVLYARIGKEERTFHIFGTHLQAGDNGLEVAIRNRQLMVIKSFIDSKNIPADEIVIMAGDFNVERGGAEYGSMLDILNATHPTTTGHPYTVDPAINQLTSSSRPRFLDYVLYSSDHLAPLSAFVETRLIFSRVGWKEFLWEPEFWDLSDHFPVYARLRFGRPAFAVSPALLDLGRVPRNVLTLITKDRGITVRSVGSGPVTILGVQLQGSAAAGFGITPDPQTVFPVILPPGASFSMGIRFMSSSTGARQAQVAVTGLDISGRPVTAHAVLLADVVAPDMDVLPTAIHFGPVRLGQQLVRNVLVTNTGSAPLSFRVNPPSQQFFQWTGDLPNVWRTVAPGGSEVVAIRYVPTAIGMHSAQLSIVSNDGTLNIPLSGQGVWP